MRTILPTKRQKEQEAERERRQTRADLDYLLMVDEAGGIDDGEEADA